MNKTTALLASLSTILSLAGCGGYPEVKKEVDEAVRRTEAQLNAARSQLPVDGKEGKKRPLVEYTNKPFLGATSVQRPMDEPLPLGSRDLTLVFAGRQSMPEAASWLSLAAGIPVTVSPDLKQAPADAANGGGGGLTVTLNYRGSLREALDGIAAQASASWQYQNSRITFYRYATKTFALPTLPNADSVVKMVIGKTATSTTGISGSGGATPQSGGVSGSATSNFSTTMGISTKPWDELAAALKSILSAEGRAIIMPSSRTVTVTDGQRQLDEVERVVSEQTRVFGRQVALRYQVISLTTTESSEFGVDWSVILNKMNGLGTGQQVFTFSGPSGSSSSSAGSFGVQLLKQVNGSADFSGSQALLKALSTVGRVRVERSWQGLVLNGRVVPIADIRTSSYLASTTPASANATGVAGGTPGLTPGSITYGFILKLMPFITSRNSLVLDIGVDLSDLNGITTQSSGTGTNQQSIELPDLSGTQMMTSTAMDTGDVLILSGMEQDTQRYDKRSLTRDGSPAAGGLFQGKIERRSLFVLVTPVVYSF